MDWMFWGNKSLLTLDVSSFDTSNVTSLKGMFSGCSQLKTLDLRGFNISKVTAMESLFNNCQNLTTTITVSNPNVATCYGMFENDAGIYGGITVNYTSSASSFVDQIIANKPAGAKVVKGVLVSL